MEFPQREHRGGGVEIWTETEGDESDRRMMKIAQNHIFIPRILVTSSESHCIRKQYEFNRVGACTCLYSTT